MSPELAVIAPNLHDLVIELGTNDIKNYNTARAYRRALTDFMLWWEADGRNPLSKAKVVKYLKSLRDDGKGGIAQRLTAIKRFAREAADNGLLDNATAAAIGNIKAERMQGRRLGNWLELKEAQTLLDLPDTTTLKGTRDRAILAVLLGCGLRREECAGLRVDHIQQREARWVIVDLIGKRDKMRSVPMPSWAKYAIDTWLLSSGVTDGLLFRATRRGGHLQPHGMTAQSIFEVVREYTAQMEGRANVRPHDLRRTFAQLAHKGKAPVEQIQLSLGHSSMQTTERYLGVKQDLHSAPCDVINLTL